MKDGFIKVSAATPEITLANPDNNAKAVINKVIETAEKGAKIIVLPQLCLSGATANDLFTSFTLTDKCLRAIGTVAKATNKIDALIIFGAPVQINGAIVNCAVVLNRGKILALVPKNELNYNEKRWFSPIYDEITVNIDGQIVPVTDKPFTCETVDCLSVEVTFDNQMPKHGALVVANLCACPHHIYRDSSAEVRALALVSISAVVRSEAGKGESSSDAAYMAHNTIVEYDDVKKDDLYMEEYDEDAIAVVDVKRMVYARQKASKKKFVTANAIPFALNPQFTNITEEEWNATPYEYWAPLSAFDIQVTALARRLGKIGAKSAVIGVSGGLDSTLALLVAVHACDLLGMDRSKVIAVTMPCFGTTKRTKNNAVALAKKLGATLRTVNVSESVKRHLKEIGHDGVTTDVTYENAQARERTQVLMDVANMENGIVIGTGDMSELALGWATYNGDHMSMYAVNAGVPKTLVRTIVDAYANRETSDKTTIRILKDILATPVSPELIPSKEGEIEQKTEDLVGPYELHDFFLYNVLENGYSARKTYRTAVVAFNGKYDEQTIEKWLRTFIRRFFAQQFKRSCMPDGPQIASVSLSPRGGLVMPSDASSALWLAELEDYLNGDKQ